MEQRTLTELRALYLLEDDLRDIFVEGEFDRRLLNLATADRDRQRSHIYRIDEVAIPDQALAEYGLSSGARSKVIVLAKKMESMLPAKSKQVTCVIDSDIEGALGPIDHGPLLLSTDYADIDGYLLTPETVGKFLSSVLGVDRDPARLLDSYFGILREPFLVRMAGHSLGCPIARVDIEKSCSMDGEDLVLDREHLINRMLQKSGAALRRDEIEAQIESFRPRLAGDRRQHLTGDDFMDLFAWHWNSEARRQGLRDHSPVRYLLLNGADANAFRREGLFRGILDRLL